MVLQSLQRSRGNTLLADCSTARIPYRRRPEMKPHLRTKVDSHYFSRETRKSVYMKHEILSDHTPRNANASQRSRLQSHDLTYRLRLQTHDISFLSRTTFYSVCIPLVYMFLARWVSDLLFTTIVFNTLLSFQSIAIWWSFELMKILNIRPTGEIFAWTCVCS